MWREGCVHAHHLRSYLEQADYPKPEQSLTYFKSEQIFDLIQMDGATLDYLEIRDEIGQWRKPVVIEFFNTGSRALLTLDVFFSESNENSTNVFCKFLSSTPFPQKTIRLRPDNAKGFLNLKRPIHELNQKYATVEGFTLLDDFARIRNPKAKVHLESSHRRLHNFELFIIREFQDRKVGTRKGTKFLASHRRDEITVTRLDISVHDLRDSGLLERYRWDHNTRRHRPTIDGVRQRSWIPADELEKYLNTVETITFSATDLETFYRYGYPKYPATVSKTGLITLRNRQYGVVSGEFSRQSSTKVKVSLYEDKLFLFEDREDGLCIGEAMPTQAPSREQLERIEAKIHKKKTENSYEKVRHYLTGLNFVINEAALLQTFNEGLTLEIAQKLVLTYMPKYLAQINAGKGFIAFNLLVADFLSYKQQQMVIKPYAQAQ